jgi:hypothetical protein
VLSATVRDIAIIIVAVQSVVIGLLLAVLIWQIWRLVKIIQTELKPIIDDTQVTVNTVRGTTQFVSHNVVEPVIQTNTRVTKWRTTTQALMRDLGFGKRTARPAPPVLPRVPPPSATPPSQPPPAAPSPAPSNPPPR